MGERSLNKDFVGPYQHAFELVRWPVELNDWLYKQTHWWVGDDTPGTTVVSFKHDTTAVEFKLRFAAYLRP